ncbi:hypothetical protein KAR91_60640 [Candidatus Pacearchaeota archaeon]|nr:hypothetical protein [Candidatus Pacearchaeota archaeon]
MAIDDFCAYFKRQIEVIDSIKLDDTLINPGDDQILLYKKTLLLSMLDAMAGFRFPKMKNRKRFIRFVKDYANWDDGRLISVPFLSDRLSSENSSDNKLAEHLKSKLSELSPEDCDAKNANIVDESLEALLSLTISESKNDILYYQHYAILYRYRNHLVHEAIEPGGAMEFYDKNDAYYESYINDLRWFLVYPLALLKQICRQCIGGLQQYLIDNQIVPHDIIKDTSRF